MPWGRGRLFNPIKEVSWKRYRMWRQAGPGLNAASFTKSCLTSDFCESSLLLCKVRTTTLASQAEVLTGEEVIDSSTWQKKT